MGKDFRWRTNGIWYLLCVVLAGATALSVGRSLIIGLDADEQYAVVLAYRLARGDIMVREIWDPHQTSAIIPAILIKGFRIFVRDNTFLLLYLRGAGILLQAGIAFLWYRTMKTGYGSRPALLTALALFHTLPKWIVTPEFANQQLWFWILTILCLYRYDETRKNRYCIFAGIALCFMILAYPSCVLLFLPYVIWMARRKRRAAVMLTLTCMVGAGIFVGYLFSYLTLSDFGLYIKYILADPSHSVGLTEKLAAYCSEAVKLAVSLLVYLAIGAVLSYIIYAGIWRHVAKGYPFNRNSFSRILFLSVVCVAVADQVRLWAFGLVPHVHPQLHYLLLYAFGGFLYNKASGEEKSRWTRLYRLAWLPSLGGFGAVLLLTNLDLKASFVHLLPGMLVALLFWCNGRNQQEETPTRGFHYRLVLPVIWVLILIGARGYLVREDEGRAENVFLVKQKALYGAAKNVYCSYMTGYQYNDDTLFLEENLAPGTKVLYVGASMMFVYLMNDMEICTPTVISTPVYDERYLKYYELNPNKLPEAIIMEQGYFRVMGPNNIPIYEWICTEYGFENRKESQFLWIVRRR